jgi:hypothetical protein
MDIKKTLEIVKHIKTANIKYDTALTVKKNHYVRDAK